MARRINGTRVRHEGGESAMWLPALCRRGSDVRARMCGTMLRRGLLRIAFLVLAVTGSPALAAQASAPSGWAVLMEHNAFGGRYADLPVGYINSTRMLTALMRRGWPADHILLTRNVHDPQALSHALGWLASHVQRGDVAVFYVASEHRFLERDLGWDATFPRLWQTIPTSHRVLIVETCHAERFTDAAKSVPGLGLPAVGRQELDWWGLRDRDGLMKGGPFTFFLARALTAQPAGAGLDFAAAFERAVTDAREYFRTVIAPAPGALSAFHALGIFPERQATFPNPRLARGVDDPALPAAVSHP